MSDFDRRFVNRPCHRPAPLSTAEPTRRRHVGNAHQTAAAAEGQLRTTARARFAPGAQDATPQLHAQGPRAHIGVDIRLPTPRRPGAAHPHRPACANSRSTRRDARRPHSQSRIAKPKIPWRARIRPVRPPLIRPRPTTPRILLSRRPPIHTHARYPIPGWPARRRRLRTAISLRRARTREPGFDFRVGGTSGRGVATLRGRTADTQSHT